MKKILFYLLFAAIYLFPQEYKYGWLSDVHIGNPTGANDLKSAVSQINSRNDLKFVVVTGDIAERGRNYQLDSAKLILDQLHIPYYIIPGNHDTKWSESGTTHFAKIFKDNKFVFQYNNTLHIGICSGVLLRGGGGHFTPEDINWVDEQLAKAPKNIEVFFYAHHPLDGDVDNGYKMINILKKYNIKGIFVGHGHVNHLLNFSGIPSVMGRSSLNNKGLWGYSVVSNTKDSIAFYTYNPKESDKYLYSIAKKELSIKNTDSTDLVLYNAVLIGKTDLNTTVNSYIVSDGSNLYTNTYDGTIYSFNNKSKINWSYKSSDKYVSTPVCVDGKLTTGSLSDSLLVFNAKNGKIINKIVTGSPITSKLAAIKLSGTKYGIILGDSYGKLSCYNLSNLTPVWKNDTAKGMIETHPLFYNNTLTYSTWDGFLYNINAGTGATNWKWTENNSIYYAPAGSIPCTDGKAVFVMQPDKFVYKIDIKSGKTIWKSDKGQGWESIGISNDKKKIFARGTAGKFYILSAKDGSLIKEFDMKYGLDITPTEIVEENGKVVFGAKNGTIFEIDKNNNFRPVLFMGVSRINNVVRLKNDTYGAVNMDGRVVIFKIK
jgi:outer membrane protein assembly factor BamB